MAVRKLSKSSVSIVGTFPSLKMANSVSYQSTIERDFIFFLEFDVAVQKYFEQPLTIQAQTSDGKPHSYTPDFLVLRNSSKELIECKPEALLDEQHTKTQVELGQQWAVANNHQFRVVTDTWLRQGSQLANLKLLWRYSRFPIRPDLSRICYEYLTYQYDDFTTTVGNLENYLTQKYADSICYALASLYFLIWQNKLYTDLAVPLTKSSIVSLNLQNVKELRHGPI